MFEFILAVCLYAAGPTVAFPVRDCTAGVAWIREARQWAARSGVDPVSGPIYACYPARFSYVMRVRRDD